ncbi:glutathione peroxidase [Rhodoferax sp. U11-2br]|uniref:glutathione peroxidase n=1 Tax=Rhodoferax sp. U11-2br TaxID=2838878 RepID=UPI001BE7F52B|nr:glutathione peroxidase [Rhodoferax sp. U11-2br]MBT3067130.1 glutathione peroxidase [Rhodoferax sp. U11-2br]
MTTSLYDITLRQANGSDTTLADYKDQVLLIVNVASKCGLTPQYEGLEKLFETYRDQGLTVLGFPANDFAGQEPGTDAEIASFCSLNYGVQFPVFSKIVVTGDNKHPLYQWLTAAQPVTEERAGVETMLRGHKIEPTSAPEVVWNFEKFLINRKGQVVRRFAPATTADAPQLVEAVKQELANK